MFLLLIYHGSTNSLYLQGFNKAIRQLSAFRDKVRQLALEKKDFKEYLKICDELRDVQLPELGVILDDQKGKIFLTIHV